MADTLTTNYSLTKPEVGASEDTWGAKLNTNFDTVDTALKANADAAAAAQSSADIALAKDPTLTLTGDVSGSATFTNLGNATLTTTIADDSHNHVISNVDGLQAALDANANAAAAAIQDSAGSVSATNVAGTDGTSGQYLISDGDGTMSWLTAPEAIPAGTAMLFQQTAAPTGWTKQTTHNDKALRVVSGSVTTGGNAAFTSAFASYTPSGNVSVAGSVSGNSGSTTLSTATMPSHTHALKLGNMGGWSSAPADRTRPQASYYNNVHSNNGIIENAGSGGSHSHSISANLTVNSSSFTGNAKDLAVQYVDVIIATKDA